MTVQPRTLEELRSKIETYLRHKQLTFEIGSGGDCRVRYGSTFAVILVREWCDRALVKLIAPVALNITRITPELTRYLVEKNNELLFGKFSLDTQNKTVWYEHALLGDFLDEEELFVTVAAVLKTADDYDEEVAKMAGGRRAVDT